MDAETKRRFAANPFYVLGLRPEASRIEVERAGQKLIAMLELGLSQAARYPTPLGERERTVDLVRQAVAELRDPERRVAHELWARLEAAPLPGVALLDEDEDEAPPPGGRLAPFAEGPRTLGWRRP